MNEHSLQKGGTRPDPSGEPDEGSNGAEETLSMDETFELLKNNRRRLVLEYLMRHDGEAKLDEIADHVTAIENDTEVSAITSTERKRVYVGLYQFHLPKMADMGVVDYQQSRGNVVLTDRGRQLHNEHERHSGSERRWYLAYLGVAGAGVLGVLVSVVLSSTAVAVALLAGQTVVLALIALANASAAGNDTFLKGFDQ